MPGTLKSLASKSLSLVLLKYILANYRVGRRYRRGNFTPEQQPNIAFSRSTDDYLSNMEQAFSSYIENGNLTPDIIRGANILELGPGDTFAMALKFIADGANKVVCLDRFQGISNNEAARAVYFEMRRRLDDVQRRRFDDAIHLDGEISINPKRLKYIFDTGVEDAAAVLKDTKFDLILSMAVLEHIADGDAAFAAMDQLLESGGTMIHGVDLRDHGMFSSRGHHPLTFLTISDPVYRLMSSNTGLPNRIWLPFYREKLTELRYRYRILVASVLGRDGPLSPHKEKLSLGIDYSVEALNTVKTIRNRLAPKFKAMTDEDLIVSTFLIKAVKP